MGWTVLYIAFGAVALWLLGEVLLQYKARLRWRLLAFFGFLTVVVGVAVLSSVIVIGLGAVAFAVGQTLVTLSYRKGFVAGWALDGLPGLPGLPDLSGLPGLPRRRDEPAADEEPAADGEPDAYGRPEAEAEFADDGQQSAEHPEPQAYAPQPLPEETGEYGIYEREQDVFAGPQTYQEAGGYPEQPAYQEHSGYPEGDFGYGQQQDAYAAWADPYAGYQGGEQQPAAASYDAGYGYGGADYTGGYGGHDPAYAGYDTSQTAGTAYGTDPNDPYAAAGYPAQGYEQPTGYDQQAGYAQTGYPQTGYDDGSGYGSYDTGYGGYGAGQDPYAAQGGYDPSQATPAEGVWVPQPREGEDAYQPQSAQGYYPYQDGYGYYGDQHGGY